MPSPSHRLAADIERLGPWFHNLRLAGIPTAPHHFLGDYPRVFFERFASALPDDLRGWSVLDVGCNAGFYAFEMARRGADRVVGIDADPAYLRQARFAADALGVRVELRQMSVFDVDRLGERFDLVLFMGVLYHLRHPLLALDLLRHYAVGRLLVFQSMQRGSAEAFDAAPDYRFEDRTPFEADAFPKLHFIEHEYAGDPTNWWVPNRAAAEAMLHSAGFRIEAHPDAEVYLCAPDGRAELPPLPGRFERGGDPAGRGA